MFGLKLNTDLPPSVLEEFSNRYDADGLEGYVVKRMAGRKRVEVAPIDFYRKGVGLTMEVPLLEQGDEVTVYLRSAKEPSLKLSGMPGVVRYRMGWRNGFRVGIEFNPLSKLIFANKLREEAERIEDYLANPGDRLNAKAPLHDEDAELSSSVVAFNQVS